MAKLTLTDFDNLENGSSAVFGLNANNAATETALENTLSRDGTSPNAMGSALDMNSNRIINVPSPLTPSEPVSLGYLNNILAGNPLFTGLITGVPVSVAMQPVVAATTLQSAQDTLGIRMVLTADLNLYVSNSGSDSNNGLSIGAPFEHIQKAIDTIYKEYDLAGFGVTINMANGTYTENIVFQGKAVGQNRGSSFIMLKGNVASPISTLVAVGSGNAVTVTHGARVHFDGVYFQAIAGDGLITTYGSESIVTRFGFGNCGNNMFSTSYNSNLDVSNTTGTIYGDAGFACFYTVLNSQTLFQSSTLTFNGTRNFVFAFLVGAVCSYSHFVGATFVGSATGTRFYLYMCGIYSDGSTANYSFLPGNAAGRAFGGAVYNNDTEFYAYTVYTPTIPTAGGTSATASGQYKAHGKNLDINIQLTITAYGGGNVLVIPLPTVNDQYNNYVLTPARFNTVLSCVDTSVGNIMACAYIGGGNNAITLTSLAGANLVNGHVYTITGRIELT